MKKDEILLSPKYGVNPSMTVCFYCGETTGIVLMGKLKGDAEAPRECCLSIEPCDKCKEKYKDYCLILEKESRDSEPTGRWFAIKKQAVSPEYRDFPILFMDSESFNSILNNYMEDTQNENK